MPATIEDSSPAVTATIVSSTNRRPSSVRPCSDQGVALLHQGDCDEISIGEPLTDRTGLGCSRVRGLVVTAERVLQENGDQ